MISGVETMSSTAVTAHTRATRPPRVREQARDAMTLMVFSAGTSVALSAGLVLLTYAGR